MTTEWKCGSVHNKSSGNNKTFSPGEASTEIVPFGRGQSYEQIGDMSMALAFALGTVENLEKWIRLATVQ